MEKSEKLNLERLVCDFLSFYPDEETKRRYMELGRYNQKQNIAINYIRDALKHAVRQQGREYKDGRLVPIERKEPGMPKFKVGDWIVYTGYLLRGSDTDGYVMQVESVEDGRYNFTDGSTLCFDSEKDMRLWTIQDAKPGDVLYCNPPETGIEYIMLFKRINNFQNIDTYCRFNSIDGFNIDVNSVASLKRDNIVPATKAQRDFLFYRLQESGYRWNEETLKLEKTEEEKPAATEKEPSEQQPAMIKASELMLGAWLRHAGTGELMQVTRIDAIRGGGHFACGSPHCWEYNNRFEPVPLTAEILEKNGFEYHSGERGMYGVTTANYYAMEGSPHIFCDGDPFAVWFEDEVPIRYVHELQHVLRLCGIEKDIEL